MVYKNKGWYGFVLFFLFSLTFSFYSSQGEDLYLNPSNYKNSKTKKVVEALKDAVELIKTKGEKGIDLIKEKNKKNGELMVLVFSFDGASIVDFDMGSQNDSDPYLQLNIDSNVIKDMMLGEAYYGDHCGWVHYKWMKKGSFYPEWKSSIVSTVLSPSGEKYIVMCGDFNLPMESLFITDFVDDFIDSFLKNRDFTSDFEKKTYMVYNNYSYIFVMDDKCRMIYNPEYPFLKSRILYDYRSYEGRYIFREMIEALSHTNEAWIEYAIQIKDKSLQKRTYLRKMKKGNETFIIAAEILN